MLTFQRAGVAHTRLLTLCVCPPGAEPWATRTFVITRPLLEADSIGRFLSALQGCCEACWHGFLKFSTGPCNYISLDVGAVVDRGVLVDPASTDSLQSAFISKSNDMCCVYSLTLNNRLFIFCPTCLGDPISTITLGWSHTD